MFRPQPLPRLLRLRSPHIFRPLRHKSTSHIPPLSVPLEEWKNVFLQKETSRRITVYNETAAERIAKAFLPKALESSDDPPIVIEAFPGPGVLSRALLSLPSSRLKKLIILEESPEFIKHLKILEEYDSRVTVIPHSGYAWSTYSEIELLGLLDEVEKQSIESDKIPNLRFISHIPHTVSGDQLVSQFIRCIAERSWLFKYGRVPLQLLMPETTWERCIADFKSKSRCKLSIIAQASAEIKTVVKPSFLEPYNENFWPNTGSRGDKKTAARRLGTPLIVGSITPLRDPLIQKGLLDKWDYVLRRLFVLKSTPLEKALSSLAPGAMNLLGRLTDHSMPEEEIVDVKKAIRLLSLQEWKTLVRVFSEWPFAPQDLGIADAITYNKERETAPRH